MTGREIGDDMARIESPLTTSIMLMKIPPGRIVGWLIAAALLLGGCAATQIINQWSNPSYAAVSFKRILVIGVSKQTTIRRNFEDEFVAQLRAAGADAVLLIAEVLATQEIVELLQLADSLGMTTLVESHNPNVLLAVHSAVRAVEPKRYLVGINNRDLSRQVTDVSTTTRVAGLLSDTSILVAESGIRTRRDVECIRRAGAAAMLVGESLMAADDIAAKVAELLV